MQAKEWEGWTGDDAPKPSSKAADDDWGKW